jgi:hypothetical protein
MSHSTASGRRRASSRWRAYRPCAVVPDRAHAPRTVTAAPGTVLNAQLHDGTMRAAAYGSVDDVRSTEHRAGRPTRKVDPCATSRGCGRSPGDRPPRPCGANRSVRASSPSVQRVTRVRSRAEGLTRGLTSSGGCRRNLRRRPGATCNVDEGVHIAVAVKRSRLATPTTSTPVLAPGGSAPPGGSAAVRAGACGTRRPRGPGAEAVIRRAGRAVTAPCDANPTTRVPARLQSVVRDRRRADHADNVVHDAAAQGCEPGRPVTRPAMLRRWR